MDLTIEDSRSERVGNLSGISIAIHWFPPMAIIQTLSVQKGKYMPSNLIKVKATTKVELDRWKKPGMTYDEVIVFLLTVWKVFHSIASGYLENKIGDEQIGSSNIAFNW